MLLSKSVVAAGWLIYVSSPDKWINIRNPIPIILFQIDLKCLSHFRRITTWTKGMHRSVRKWDNATYMYSFSYWFHWFFDSRILRRSLVIFVTVIVVYAVVVPLVVHHSPWIQRSVAFARKCWVTGEPTSRRPLQVPWFQLTVQRGSTTPVRRNWALKTRSTSTSARKTEPRLESGTLDAYA